MGKARKIYQDKAGNKIYKRYIKTRKIWQYSAKNRQGRIVDTSSFNSLAKKARLKVRKR